MMADAFSGGDLLIALAVLLAAAEVFNVAVKTARNIRRIKQPSDELIKNVAEHSAMLNKDKKRLDGMENGQRALCTALLALLNHEITGNSIDKLRDAKDALTNYLISK